MVKKHEGFWIVIVVKMYSTARLSHACARKNSKHVRNFISLLMFKLAVPTLRSSCRRRTFTTTQILPAGHNKVG
jgi:hypothetical protein